MFFFYIIYVYNLQLYTRIRTYIIGIKRFFLHSDIQYWPFIDYVQIYKKRLKRDATSTVINNNCKIFSVSQSYIYGISRWMNYYETKTYIGKKTLYICPLYIYICTNFILKLHFIQLHVLMYLTFAQDSTVMQESLASIVSRHKFTFLAPT